ncbi:MAG: phage shock protein PspA [Nevskiaceae bacterium]|nr:MAG: phage shock protein PspA [Nevskiaceae bacterium]
MGIFSRRNDVINSDLSKMLGKAGDPEKLVRLIIQEMEDTLVEVRSTGVRSIARKKELQRGIADAQHEALDWESKAELALSKDREDLARGALAARQRALDRVPALERELKLIDEELAKLDSDTTKLRAKLADARSRQKSLSLRSQTSSSRLKVREQLDDRRVSDTLQKMDQFESHVERLEAQVDAYDLGQRTLADEIAALAPNNKIEDELAKLRAKLGKNTAPASSGTKE